MVRVASGAVAQNFRVHRGAAIQRQLALFQDQHPRTLAEHKAVTRFVERARGRGGIVIARNRHRSHDAETLHNSRRDRRVGAAADQMIRKTEANHIEGVSQRIG